MLYYYFGSKDDLFLAVLERDLRPHPHGGEGAVAARRARRRKACGGWSRFTWQYYLDHPEFLTLLNSENLHGASHLQALASASAR